MTVREAILQYVFGLVERIPIQNVTAYRSREEAVARSEGIAVLVQPKDERKTQMGGVQTGRGIVMRDFAFTVNVLTRGDVPDQIADPVAEAMHKLIFADRTFGNLVSVLTEGDSEWSIDEADAAAGELMNEYIARYQTTADDLSQSF